MANESDTKSDSDSTKQPPKKSSWWQNLSPKNKKTINIIGAFILFAAIGTSAYYYGQQNDQPEPSPSPSPNLSLEIETSDSDGETANVNPTPIASPTASPSPSPSATPTPAPESQSMSLSAQASLDGFRSSNNAGSDGMDIRVGRNVNLITRGFVSFDLNDIPDGATIESVKLAVYQADIKGDPFGAGIRVKVDHLDYGDSLTSSDYSASSISSSFATLTGDSSVGWKEVDVTDQVKADLAASRSRSQFRFHLAVENQGGTVSGDFIYYESAENSEGTGNVPKLDVTYH